MKKEAPIYLFVILRGFIKIAHFFAGIISFLERVSYIAFEMIRNTPF